MPKFYDGHGFTMEHATEDAMRKRKHAGNLKPAKIVEHLMSWNDGFIDYHVVVTDA